MKTYITALFVLLSIEGFSQQLRVVNLSCERKANPTGVENPAPLFSWQVETTHRGYIQSAYQLQISEDSSSFNGGATPRIISPQSNMVPYTGEKLLPGHRYYWRVQVWDQLQRSSGWSPVASFTTGLYTKADWSNAQWIGYEDLPDSMRLTPGVHKGEEKFYELHKAKQRTVVPLFRKTFKANGKIKRAYLFISGMGQYEVNMNGKKVGDNFLAPGWTYYDKRVLYNTYDVTSLLNQGNNA
ncbi:MAG TPA: alpha-L-rhamnosidase N-terminal domain-containing protein, partial [Chitinophaga sp.]|nr:alpha-L-rhamnosidase N-terminal domain-containing protein [Chitinophaga sp.]